VERLSLLAENAGRWLCFDGAQSLLVCEDPAELPGLLAQLDAACARGAWVAGFLAYEAAQGLGLAVQPGAGDGLPLACFGVYSAPREERPPAPGSERFTADEWRPRLGPDEYARAVGTIQEAIARGDTYQVNFTFPLVAACTGDPRSLFARMVAAQGAGRAVYADLGRHVIVSASPELFFALDGESIVARPMKGTAPRGRTPPEDDRAAAALAASPKERAENVMIADMIRNDLGRVARFGSVRVPVLFEVERYPTVLQMVSAVTADTRASLGEILTALFPCASVTGAPKRRTMEIIAALEPAPRGIYTGAIGWMGPGRQGCFSVAIRTAVVDRQRGLATYGVGSGIVADSKAEAEYAECLLKARVLSESPLATCVASLPARFVP
jgi:para-aminobenzoate synthetase/4-amino-4-deoxychorismate lyase